MLETATTRPMASTNSVLSAEQLAAIELPDRDVRTALDAAVKRGWSEQTRRFARVALLLIADTLVGLAGIALVLETWWLVSNDGLRPVPNAIPLIAMVCCIQPLALRVTGAYGGGRNRVKASRIAPALAIAALVGWVQALLFLPSWQTFPNKTAYVYSAAVITLLIWVERLIVDSVIQRALAAGYLQRRVLLIAHRDELEEAQRRVDYASASDVRIVAAISPQTLIMQPSVFDQTIATSKAHAVVVAASLPREMLDPLMARCFDNGIGMSLLPGGIQDFGSAYFELRPSSVGLLLQVFPMRFGIPQLAIKRTVDVLLTLIGLSFTWPLFGFLALAIKLDSRGPVLFRQPRVGVGGRIFKMLKFRTMHIGADEKKAQLQALNESGDPRLFKIRNDPRVTRLGRILRRYSLDELPQVFNVLKGEMSLVGPRPFFPTDLPNYELHHFERLHVLPGITGLWQVSGRSDVLDFEEVVRLDQQYIRNWSLATDLLILLRTIPAALGRGAY